MSEIDQLQAFARDLKELAQDISSGQYAVYVAHECAQAIEEDIDTIYETAIDEFYNAYHPKYYVRTRSLYDVYEITPDDFGVAWEDPAFYPGGHRVGGEYIYQYAFNLGFHGGATPGSREKKDAHGKLHPGGIVYRSPAPSRGNKPYIYWGRQAVQTPAPSTMVGRNILKYQNGGANTSGHTALERIEDAIDYVNLRYDVFNWG